MSDGVNRKVITREAMLSNNVIKFRLKSEAEDIIIKLKAMNGKMKTSEKILVMYRRLTKGRLGDIT